MPSAQLQGMIRTPRKEFQASKLGQRWKIRPTILILVAVILVTGCSSNTTPFNPLRVDPDLKRGPYVQLGGTESILVVWQTIPVTQRAVEFGLTESLGTKITSSEFGTTHSLSLTGLQSNTYYYYRVLDGDRPLSRIVRFHTNHESSDTNFSFLVLGDSGNGSAEMFAVANLINASGASFGLHTGDVIYPHGEERFYDSSFFWPYAPFLATNVMYTSLGNHDTNTDNGAPYLNNFHLPANNWHGTERYYSFDYGHAHFVALDTNLPTAPGSAQRTWLEQDLAVSTKPWKFVFFHHPPYSAGVVTIDGERFELAHMLVRRNLVPLFELFGVDIVFSGHAHSYERTFPILQNQAVNQGQEPDYVNPSGPIYVITGGGGAGLLGLDSSSFNVRAVAAHHIVEISLSDDEMIGRAIRPSGLVIDEFRVGQ
jgi:predicted phosphodiesterase